MYSMKIELGGLPSKNVILKLTDSKGTDKIILLCPINNEFETQIIEINDIQALASIIWHRSSFKKDSNEN